MTYKFKIEGLDCPNCAAKLGDKMSKADGVTSAKINFLAEKLTVESDLEEDALLALLSSIAADFEDGVTVRK
ncbi:MAG: cation transporter [Clostridia bacterium]|nr:cation transporter [Clostridia bacterium]MBP5270318.1 cation transporter [Clostridia bacterium]